MLKSHSKNLLIIQIKPFLPYFSIRSCYRCSIIMIVHRYLLFWQEHNKKCSVDKLIPLYIVGANFLLIRHAFGKSCHQLSVTLLQMIALQFNFTVLDGTIHNITSVNLHTILLVSYLCPCEIIVANLNVNCRLRYHGASLIRI